MAHYTLIARINAGNGRLPFVNVQFTKTHRPIPIAAATYAARNDPRCCAGPGVDRAAKALNGWQHEWGYARTEDFWLLQASAHSASCS